MDKTIFNFKSLIFILVLILSFASCKKDEEVVIDLKVDKNMLEIDSGKTAIIN